MELKFVPNIGNGGLGENGGETRMNFVAECLKGLLQRLNRTDVDKIEDVPGYVLGSPFSKG
jgi:hypothetical protein